MLAALELLNDFAQSGNSVAQWADYKWNIGWRENTFRLHLFIAAISSVPFEMFFPRPPWVRLNRLRISFGLFCSTMHKWGMAPTTVCESGAKEQTAEHVMLSCPIYHHPNGARVLSAVDKNLVPWLTDTCPAILWTAF